jgi:phage terminase small subunit
MPNELTEKQRIFCIEYLKDFNGTRAYKAAYPHIKKDNTAAAASSRLLRNVNIKAYIDKCLEEIESDLIADAKEVMKYLTAVMRGQEEEEIVGFTDYGTEKVKKLPYVKDRVKAAELLGKRYNLFTDNVNLSGEVGVQIVDDIE